MKKKTNKMAQFRLHGNKALIIQSFNWLGNTIEIMSFDADDYGFKEVKAKKWKKRLIKNNFRNDI
jgi:hypothetical protein